MKKTYLFGILALIIAFSLQAKATINSTPDWTWYTNLELLNISTTGAQVGDVVTVGIDGATTTKTVSYVVNGRWAGFTYQELDLEQDYPFTVVIQRGSEYATSTHLAEGPY